MKNIFLFISLVLLSPLLAYPSPLEVAAIEQQVSIDLVDPVYEDGVLSTDQGGVLTAKHLRVQARHIVYTKRLNQCPPEYCLYCEGDLLIDFRGKTLTGQCLYYDLLTNSGTLYDGKAGIHPLYVRGGEVKLLENGAVCIDRGYVTTTEGEVKEVIGAAKQISLTDNHLVSLSSPLFFIRGVPVFWFPGFKYDLSKVSHFPFTVKVGWGGFLDAYISLRYHCLTLGDFLGYLRLDGYLKRGLGGGIETEYAPSCLPLELYTRSYYANDLSIADPEKRHRYRFEGVYYGQIFDSTAINFTYDVVSDGEMAADYINEDFDLQTAGRTELDINHQADGWIADLLTRVRVNSFQSINQELPTLTYNWHPAEIGCGVMVENWIKASYLSYVFSDQDKCEKPFAAGRFAIHPRLYRSFTWGPLIFTPEIAYSGIAYSRGPNTHHSLGQSVGEFVAHLEAPLWRSYGCGTHTVSPYLHFEYLTHPRVPVDEYFLFSISDAYAPLKIIRFGVKNSVLLPCCMRPLYLDVWTNAYFDSHTIPPAIPKGYLNLEWTPYSRLYLSLDSGVNFEHHQLDFINTVAEWTVNEDLALIFEHRHRGRFAWRKADFYNFLLDATRSQNELLASNLSDRRDLFTGKIFYRLTPETTLKLYYRYCWNRKTEKTDFNKDDSDCPLIFSQRPFSAIETEISTLLFDHWRFSFVYEKRHKDNRFSCSLKLVP